MNNYHIYNKQKSYGFGGRLNEAFPSQIIVDLTEVCNLECSHCPHPSFKASPHYGARFLPVELNTKMVDEVREHGQNKTQYIRYTSNGEPLIHPKAYQMIEDAVKRSGVYVTLTTNGTIMNERRTKRLLDAGIHMIDISIDAHTPETYAHIRINGDLCTTRRNVENLIRWNHQLGHTTKIVVSFIKQPENTSEIEAFTGFWEEKGADSVVIRNLHSAAGAVPTIAANMRISNKSERRPCVYPWERITVDARGFLAFCPTDWNHGSTIADYRTATIKETWNSEFYSRLRNAHLENNFDLHKFCGQCPDWAISRWPNEGRSYADLIAELKQ